MSSLIWIIFRTTEFDNNRRSQIFYFFIRILHIQIDFKFPPSFQKCAGPGLGPAAQEGEHHGGPEQLQHVGQPLGDGQEVLRVHPAAGAARRADRPGGFRRHGRQDLRRVPDLQRPERPTEQLCPGRRRGELQILQGKKRRSLLLSTSRYYKGITCSNETFVGRIISHTFFVIISKIFIE